MFTAMKCAIAGAKVAKKAKTAVHGWFLRTFKEQAGGAEVIATLIIIAVVLVLALAFRDNISDLVKSLWNSMTEIGEEGADPEIPEWE